MCSIQTIFYDYERLNELAKRCSQLESNAKHYSDKVNKIIVDLDESTNQISTCNAEILVNLNELDTLKPPITTNSETVEDLLA